MLFIVEIPASVHHFINMMEIIQLENEPIRNEELALQLLEKYTLLYSKLV